MVDALLDMKQWETNSANSMGNTAPTWGARRGYDGVLKELLERDEVRPNLARHLLWLDAPLVGG